MVASGRERPSGALGIADLGVVHVTTDCLEEGHRIIWMSLRGRGAWNQLPVSCMFNRVGLAAPH